jgi:hypothetical protein
MVLRVSLVGEVGIQHDGIAIAERALGVPDGPY